MTIEQHSDRLNEDINIFYYKYMYLYILYVLLQELFPFKTGISLICFKVHIFPNYEKIILINTSIKQEIII
jgi:hypothetical protein